MITEKVQQTAKTHSESDSTETPPLLTGEELYALGYVGRSELIQGKLVRMPPTGYSHGIIEGDVAAILRNFVRQHKLGYVLSGEVGIYTHRNPDTVRGADVAYVSNKRFAQIQSQSYLDVAPELIVEILSPGDSWTEIADKLEEYFAIGVQIVWLVNPKHQEVFVYHSPTEAECFTTEDRLSGGTVLPGFEVAVAEVFGSTTVCKS